MVGPLTPETARRWLDDEWASVLSSVDKAPDPDIDRFVDSNSVSIRYAFVTQLLGKVADHRRSLLCLQKGEAQDGSWDARSFSTAVVVPWVADNHDVLGTSAEPYASKPLRRVRLTSEMPDVRAKTEWRNLVAFLDPLDREPPEEIRRVFKRCLHSLARRLSRQSFRYRIPKRIGLHDLDALLERFLGEPSAGLRPLAVAAALFNVLGDGFSLFEEVRSQGLNEADTASGMPGDIVCYDGEGSVALVVEVKEIDLTLADFRASVRKATDAESLLSNLLFAVPGTRKSDRAEIDTLTRSRWAAGLNVYRIDIGTLVRAGFALLDESWRTNFLRAVGEELDARGDHAHREAWHSLLSALADS